MQCKIDAFKHKHGISHKTDTIVLSEVKNASEVISYANATNAGVRLHDFNENIFDFKKEESEVKEIVIKQDSIKKFEAHLILSEEYQKLKENKYDALFDYNEEILEEDEDYYEDQDNKPLYAISSFIPGTTTTSPSSLQEWKNRRIEIKTELEKLAKKFGKLKEREKQKQTYNLIEKLDDEIQSIDDKDPNTVYESAVREIEMIETFLNDTLNNTSSLNAAEMIETNLLYQRIEDLGKFFLAIDPLTGFKYSYDELGDDGNVVSKFFFDFKKGLDTTKSEELQKRVQSLKDKFDRAQVKIITDLLENDTNIVYHMKHNTNGFTIDQLNKLREAVAKGDLNISGLSQTFLGMTSGGGILGNLLYNFREAAYNKEIGLTKDLIDKLSITWQKIKTKSESDGTWIVEKLFKKDEFGIRQNSFVSKYSDLYEEAKKIAFQARGAFYKRPNATNYRHWMSYEKKNFDRVNIMKIRSIADKYQSHAKFGKYFIHSDSEIDDYENDLKVILGSTMFDIEVGKALKALEEYDASITARTMTFQQEHRRNPFEFINNYESANYNQADTTTGFFLEPNFTIKIPKSSRKDLINPDFDVIDNNKDLADFYKVGKELLEDYAQPILSAEGINLKINELPSYEDARDRVAIRDLSLWGKITNSLADMFFKHRASYYNTSINKIKDSNEALKDSGDAQNYKRKLHVPSIQYGKTNIVQMKNDNMSRPLDELLKEAKKEGMTIRNVPKATDVIAYNDFKAKLAHSLAQNKINKSTSTNIFEGIKNATILANNVSSNRTTVGILEVLKGFAKNTNNTNIHKFLTISGDENIYGQKFSKDYDTEEQNRSFTTVDTKFWTKNLNSKSLSPIEREMKKLFKAEQANLDGKDNFNFQRGDVKFYTKNGKYFMEKGSAAPIVINLNRIKTEYEVYLKEATDALGIKMSVGSLGLGLMHNMVKKMLAMNPGSGIMNKIDGAVQNDAAAASGIYGFKERQLSYSRRMLAGTNTAKYFAPKSMQKTARGRQLETIKLLQSHLNLTQNKADELALEGAFEGQTIGSKFVDFMMDFSVNNPEWHNQTELLLSIMQDTFVKDKKSGNLHPLLNGKTQETIWKPGTMELKDEFDTPENRKLWVEFQEYTDEVTGEKNTDSLFFINKVKGVISRTQGNYNNRDITNAQSSVTGKFLTMFTRYVPEHVNRQWGRGDFDFLTAHMNTKGRKLNIAEHAPTAFLYMTGMHGKSIITGIAMVTMSVTGVMPALFVAAGLTTLIWNAVRFYQKSVNLQMALSKNELLLALDFAKETLARTVRTPITKLSFNANAVNGVMLDTIENIQNKGVGRGLSERERLQLSECAQDLANKFYYHALLTLTALGIKVLVASLLGGPDDDDEDKDGTIKKLIKEIVSSEALMNKVINMRNSIGNNLEKMSNPVAFLHDTSTSVYFRTLGETVKFLTVDLYKVLKGEDEMDTDFVSKGIRKIPLLPIPNSVVKSVLGGNNSGMFMDDRIYERKDFIDKFVYKGVKKEENEMEQLLEEERAPYKKRAEKLVEKRLTELYPGMKEEVVKKRTEAISKGLLRISFKNPDITFKKLHDKMNKETAEGKTKWDLIEKRLDKYEKQTEKSVKDKENKK